MMQTCAAFVERYIPTFGAWGAAAPEVVGKWVKAVRVVTRAALLTGVPQKIAKVTVVLILAVVLVQTVLCIVWRNALERKLALIHAQGKPVSVTDIIPKPVPDSRNAALLYERAFAEANKVCYYGSHDAIYYFVSSDAEPRNRNELVSEVREMVNRSNAALTLAKQAAASADPAYFQKDWRVFPPNALPFGELRGLSQLLNARAILLSDEAKMDEAVSDVVAAIRLQRAGESEPLLGSQMYRAYYVRHSLDGLRAIADTHEFSHSQARRVYDGLNSISLNPAYNRALEEDRVGLTWLCYVARRDFGYFKGLTGHSSWAERAYHRVAGYLWRPLSYKDQMIGLELQDRRIREARLPFRVTRESHASLCQTIQATPKYALVTRNFLSWSSDQSAFRDMTLTQISLAKAAMALKAYKSRFGSYPSSLDELMAKLNWELSDDPFSGKPLVYKRAGQGFLLYSVGRNLRDDGGAKWDGTLRVSSGRETSHGDIAWTCKT